MTDDRPAETASGWAERDRFLGLRDQRPLLEERLAELARVFSTQHDATAARLGEITRQIRERLGTADEALEGARAHYAQIFRELPSRPADALPRHSAHEVETRLAVLYRQVRLGPGRALDRVPPRRTLQALLDDMKRNYGTEIEKLPETVSILKAKRKAPPVPAGQRVCDVHAEPLQAAAGGLPLLGPARRSILRFRLWTSYEVLDVPARDIAREQVLDASGLKADDLVAEYVDVHKKAKEELDETWRIVRSNVEVAIEDLLGHAPVPSDDKPPSPEEVARELDEMVGGALSRARERLAGIAEPYETFVASVLERIRADQTAVLEQLRHDWERSEDFAVRLRWERRRLASRVSGWLSRLTRGLRFLWRHVTRTARRVYFRGEDATLRLGRAVGINIRSQETLLAFADLPNAQDVEERTRSLPTICRRLFSSEPLRTREMLVGREEAMTTLTDVVKRWKAGRPSSVAVVGPEGSGKTTLLNCFEAELDEETPLDWFEFGARVRTEEELVATLSGWFEMDPPVASLGELVDRLADAPPRIVVVEGGHHLLRRAIGGRRLPEAFMSLVLSTRTRILWVLTMRKYPWRRMDELLQVAQYFTHTVETPFHTSDELREAILLRQRSSGLRLHFSAEGVSDRKIRKLLLSQPIDSDVVQDALRTRYFETLFGATGGNMDSALFYWLDSLSADQNGERLVVAPLQRPDTAFFSRFERIYLFTLAEILNHGTLTVDEHSSIFRVRRLRSRVVMNYLHQLHLIKSVPVTDGDSDVSPRYAINPVFWHLVSSSLETARILY